MHFVLVSISSRYLASYFYLYKNQHGNLVHDSIFKHGKLILYMAVDSETPITKSAMRLLRQGMTWQKISKDGQNKYE